MRTDDRLTFVLEAQANESDDTERIAVHPIYEGLKLSHSRKDGKMYYDTKVSGELSFVGGEMMWIHQHSLLTKFTLIVNDMGVEFVRGTFRKTDCKTDVDHRIITTSIEANDLYEAIDGSNEEWNMVKWGLEKHSLEFSLKPQVQIYEVGGSNMHVLSNGNSYYKGTVEDGSEVSDIDELQSTYHFNIKYNGAIYVGGDDEYSGTYLFNGLFGTNAVDEYRCTNGNGWYMKMRRISLSESPTGKHQLWLENAIGDDATTRYRVWVGNEIYFTPEEWCGMTNLDFQTYPQVGHAFYASARFVRIATRVVHFKDNVELYNNYPMPSGDFYDLSHTYVSDNAESRSIIMSSRLSDEDNGYKKYNSTKWYAPPYDTDTLVPIYTNKWWNGISMWVSKGYPISIDSMLGTNATTNDWYELGDVIAGILNMIDPSIVFEKDSDHSQFFYGEQDPIKGGDPLKLYITQKSNLLEYRYEYPAWSALITWNRLETMLRNMFNLYYDIYVDADGVKHFRLEHWYFYHNGLSYGESSRNSVDLRAVYDMHNGKPMSYKTRQWSYDTDRPYTRREFGWMDNQSEPFDAYPMQVPASLMIYSRNTIDDRTTDWFSADIDFMLSNNGDASSDGFVIVSADDDGMIEQGVVTIGGISYYCQNYRMALGSLQKDYLLSDWYSPSVTIDNTEDLVEVEESMRKGMRLQTVEFRLPADVRPNPESLYVTEIGAGEVESIEIDLTSMEVSATLRHDSEEISNE